MIAFITVALLALYFFLKAMVLAMADEERRS